MLLVPLDHDWFLYTSSAYQQRRCAFNKCASFLEEGQSFPALKVEADPVASDCDGFADDNFASHVSHTLDYCAVKAVKSWTLQKACTEYEEQDACMQDVC